MITMKMGTSLIFSSFNKMAKAFCFCMIVTGCVAACAQGLANDSNSTIDLRALIIGVSNTPQLKSLPILEGVSSDVRAMRKFAFQLGVKPSKLTVLSDSEPISATPTLNNILEAFSKLEKSATTNSHFLIYLSGHGAQQPIQTNAKAAGNEFDGFDEVFLTADAQPYNMIERTTPGALTDNMLGEILIRLSRKGAHIWLIVDSCNSGTLTRGALSNDADAKDYIIVGKRGASQEAIGVPASISRPLAIGKGQALKERLSVLFPTVEKKQTIASQWPKVTAFYATGEAGEAVEVKLNISPTLAKSNEARGLFTYLLTTEANKLLETTGKNSIISYRLLMQRVLARYRQNVPKSAPLPTFEGVSNTAWFGVEASIPTSVRLPVLSQTH